MKIIVLYGDIAVGKLTVAKEFVKTSGFKLFHNHLSHDLISSFIESRDDFFWDSVRKIRFDCVLMAKKKGVDLVMTTGYAGEESDGYIKGLIELCEKERIDLDFVHLFCNEEELMKRVGGESRKKHGKLLCSSKLKKFIDEKGVGLSIPYVDSLEIDNFEMSAEDVARLIKKKLL